MKIDAITEAYTDALDRVYPPMKWRSVWSSGDNIPLGIAFPSAWSSALKLPNFYERGLFLFSEEGHPHHIPDLDESAAGRQVVAYNRREAEARLRIALREKQ